MFSTTTQHGDITMAYDGVVVPLRRPAVGSLHRVSCVYAKNPCIYAAPPEAKCVCLVYNHVCIWLNYNHSLTLK